MLHVESQSYSLQVKLYTEHTHAHIHKGTCSPYSWLMLAFPTLYGITPDKQYVIIPTLCVSGDTSIRLSAQAAIPVDLGCYVCR